MTHDLHIPILNVFLDDQHEVMPPGCVNHDDRARVTNLDGDNLCQECADAFGWPRDLAATVPNKGKRDGARTRLADHLSEGGLIHHREAS